VWVSTIDPYSFDGAQSDRWLKNRHGKPTTADERNRLCSRIGKPVDGESHGSANTKLAKRITHDGDEISRADFEQKRQGLAAGDAYSKPIFVLSLKPADNQAHPAVHNRSGGTCLTLPSDCSRKVCSSARMAWRRSSRSEISERRRMSVISRERENLTAKNTKTANYKGCAPGRRTADGAYRPRNRINF